jgi:HSP20 family protein
MRLTKWQPTATLNQLHDEFDQMFERFFGNTQQLEPAYRGTFLPNVDVIEQKNDILVRCELPGMEAKDIDISCDGSTLTFVGERKSEHEQKGDNFYRFESRFGKFQRVVTLPSEVLAKNAKATFKNGVLEVVVPKSEDAKSKEVKVKIT